MHTHVKSLIAVLLISSPLIASAVDEHHPEQASTAPAQATAPAMPMPMQDRAMTEQMQKMQAAHDKIATAKTPAERQAAMQEGMATMKEGLAMMQMNCKGMGGGKDGADMGMMDMMMKMMNQQSHMMQMPMGQ